MYMCMQERREKGTSFVSRLREISPRFLSGDDSRLVSGHGGTPVDKE